MKQTQSKTEPRWPLLWCSNDNDKKIIRLATVADMLCAQHVILRLCPSTRYCLSTVSEKKTYTMIRRHMNQYFLRCRS